MYALVKYHIFLLVKTDDALELSEMYYEWKIMVMLVNIICSIWYLHINW
jgi:hypothetical protein